MKEREREREVLDGSREERIEHEGGRKREFQREETRGEKRHGKYEVVKVQKRERERE